MERISCLAESHNYAFVVYAKFLFTLINIEKRADGEHIFETWWKNAGMLPFAQLRYQCGDGLLVKCSEFHWLYFHRMESTFELNKCCGLIKLKSSSRNERGQVIVVPVSHTCCRDRVSCCGISYGPFWGWIVRYRRGAPQEAALQRAIKYRYFLLPQSSVALYFSRTHNCD